MIYKSALFYDQYAKFYVKYLKKREKYHITTERIIIQRLKKANCTSLIDLGCGNGHRGNKIAQKSSIQKLYLVDNSQEMFNLSKNISSGIHLLSDISDKKFQVPTKVDAAICLANVLGHVGSRKKREQTLHNIKTNLKKDGILFIDVNNRYNISSYGIIRTTRNWLLDKFNPSEKNGTYCTNIPYVKDNISTKVHLFSPKEIESLLIKTGFEIKKRYVVDYSTGKIQNSTFKGQLLYEAKIK